MKPETKKEKWIKKCADALMSGKMNLRQLRKAMGAESISGTQQKKILAEASKIIHSEAEDIKEMAVDLNILRLNDIADKADSTTDRISGIDKLNKMLGAYTVNIDLTENVRFVLGDADGLENGFQYDDEDEETKTE